MRSSTAPASGVGTSYSSISKGLPYSLQTTMRPFMAILLSQTSVGCSHRHVLYVPNDGVLSAPYHMTRALGSLSCYTRRGHGESASVTGESQNRRRHGRSGCAGWYGGREAAGYRHSERAYPSDSARAARGSL